MDTNIEMSGNIDVGTSSGKSHDKSSPTDIRQQFVNLISIKPGELFGLIRKNTKPWTQFAAIANYNTPSNVIRLKNRILHNLEHFQYNYLFIFVILFVYCLLTSPLILIIIGAVMYGCYRIRAHGQIVTIFQRPLSTAHQCLALNGVAAPLLYLAGAGAALFWVLGASFLFISLHAIFYDVESLGVTGSSEEKYGFLAEIV